MFKPVSSQVDFPKLEEELVNYWYNQGIVEKYLKRNQTSNKKFSFLDGPITANNPMGVHHAWGRTYKDLWQRFYNMKGFRQRFQNGFDEQGLWVEVEVEKELGLKTKKDIENLVSGDKIASLEKFINLCKERVKKYSGIQTEQSKRLGYFMDWDHSYHTSSDENNYWIWKYLKTVHQKGWLYKGRDSVPWCPRCGTAISQHEILTEEYQEIAHETVFFKLPVLNRDFSLLVWTTTPWTIPANVAVAINPNFKYRIWKLSNDEKVVTVNPGEIEDKESQDWFYRYISVAGFEHEKGFPDINGKDLIGLRYRGPFDRLPKVEEAHLENPETFHSVIAAKDLVIASKGTGLLHVAPGAGEEDFKLGKDNKLSVIEVIDEAANYLNGMGEFSDQNAKDHPEIIINFLKEKDGGRFILKTAPITHRYPTCWRCKTELVWRVVDEWYISMDIADDTGKTYREQMIEVAKKINWMPKWGLDRELDWLKNMHDWLISKKRYWGLALPIWECQKCSHFEVIGGKEELKERAVEGWDEFEGNSPHRPWVDQVKIKCPKCGEVTSRIPDVGNPWLDAGIVPFSTMPENWFPADFITESFPGQFKNWFYSLIAMSTALKGENPFKNVLGFASLRDEKGGEMHKSKGNAIEFNEGASKIGADVMRWMYVTQNPEINLNFGYNIASEVKKRFYLILWNCYKFFVDYASLANWNNDLKSGEPTALDKWILARLNELVLLVNARLEKYDAASASRAIEEFVINDFSTWYIRRSRNRVGPEAKDKDRNASLSVMYKVLMTLTKLAAPFIPFVTEEMFRNLTGEESVHLQDYPEGDKSMLNEKLVTDIMVVRKLAEQAHAQRKEAAVKLRQPLGVFTYHTTERLNEQLEQILADELNVKKVEYQKSSDGQLKVTLDTKITPELQEEGVARELIRQIQQLRKDQNLTLADKTKVEVPSWPAKFEDLILKSTASISLSIGSEIKVSKV